MIGIPGQQNSGGHRPVVAALVVIDSLPPAFALLELQTRRLCRLDQVFAKVGDLTLSRPRIQAAHHNSHKNHKVNLGFPKASHEPIADWLVTLHYALVSNIGGRFVTIQNQHSRQAQILADVAACRDSTCRHMSREFSIEHSPSNSSVGFLRPTSSCTSGSLFGSSFCVLLLPNSSGVTMSVNACDKTKHRSGGA